MRTDSRKHLHGEHLAELEKNFSGGHNPKLRVLLELCEHAAGEVLMELGIDGEGNPTRPVTDNGALRDALAVGFAAELLRDELSVDECGEDEGEQSRRHAEWIAELGAELAYRAVRLVVRKWVPEVNAGRKLQAIGRRLHARTHGDEATKAKRWAEFQAKVNELRKTNPNDSRNWICARVARLFNVSTKTVVNRTTWD